MGFAHRPPTVITFFIMKTNLIPSLLNGGLNMTRRKVGEAHQHPSGFNYTSENHVEAPTRADSNNMSRDKASSYQTRTKLQDKYIEGN